MSDLYQAQAHATPSPKPNSVSDWDRRKEDVEKQAIPSSGAYAAKLIVALEDSLVGDLPVLKIRPPDYEAGQCSLIYLHGGAYTRFSARSRLHAPALVAIATGIEVISVDYTVAPRGTWITQTDQVISVWRAMLAGGFASSSVGLFGDSSGGGLASGSVLKMRDQGFCLPGALYLMSPWSDLTGAGDSYQNTR